MHTSGPWEVMEHSWSRTGIYAGGKGIAALDIADEATEETEDEMMSEMAANARLMAAAPDLLAALLMIEAAAIDDNQCDADTPTWKAIDKARDAIAKATGA